MLSIALYLLTHAMLLSLHLSGGSFPRPLSAQEEKKYVERMLAGDIEARNVLVEHNLRLVAHIAKKYYTQSDEQDDLISIGTIGLIKGVSSYRPEKGTRLATYAAKCVENTKEKYNGVARKGVEAIEMKLKGYEATEIAKHYDTSVNNVNAWISRARSKLRNEPALLEILY